MLKSELLSLQSTRCAHRRVPVEAEPSLRAYVHAVMSEAIRSRVDGQIAEQRIMCVCFAKVDGLEERLTAPVGAGAGSACTMHSLRPPEPGSVQWKRIMILASNLSSTSARGSLPAATRATRATRA